MEVDLHVRGEDERRLDVVPGSGELVETPAKDHLCFGLIDRLELGRSHRSPFVDGAVELQVASSGAFWASLEVQTARAKGLVPPRDRPSDEGRNPRPSAPECRHRPLWIPVDAACAPHPASCAMRGGDRSEEPRWVAPRGRRRYVRDRLDAVEPGPRFAGLLIRAPGVVQEWSDHDDDCRADSHAEPNRTEDQDGGDSDQEERGRRTSQLERIAHSMPSLGAGGTVRN